MKDLLRPEYGDKNVTRVAANTLEELAAKVEGVDSEAFLKTVRKFYDAVQTEIPFDHSVKDGRHTKGIELTKSNLANPIDPPPVLDVNFHRIPGLYTAGEMIGSLFHFNCPAGTGLVSSTVFGRIAGSAAGAAALVA